MVVGDALLYFVSACVCTCLCVPVCMHVCGWEGGGLLYLTHILALSVTERVD